MRHIYEIDCGRGGPYWEVHVERDNGVMEMIRDLQGQNELDLYLDICRDMGVDFVIHTLEEYDEYHVALPSV